MVVVRITVECIVMELKMYISTLDFKGKMKVLEAPIRSLYLAALLLLNMCNFIYPNQISQHF